MLELVGTVSFRYTVVSRLNTNDLEPVYHRAAKSVKDGEASTPAAVFEILEPIYVDDEKMRQDFALLAIDPKGRRREACEVRSHAVGTGRFRPRLRPKHRHCDHRHILPEKPAETWKEIYPSEQWESGGRRLGNRNLTLLEVYANREIANESYRNKLAVYEQSVYALTRQIVEMALEQWTPELLDKRQG